MSTYRVLTVLAVVILRGNSIFYCHQLALPSICLVIPQMVNIIKFTVTVEKQCIHTFNVIRWQTARACYAKDICNPINPGPNALCRE